jgi:tetratricopeptide (TPR) repeat protein
VGHCEKEHYSIEFKYKIYKKENRVTKGTGDKKDFLLKTWEYEMYENDKTLALAYYNIGKALEKMGAYNESIENLTKSIQLLNVQKEPPAGLIKVVEKFKVTVISKKVRKIRTLKTGIEKVSLRNRKMDFREYLSQNPAGDEKDYDFNGVSQLYIDLDVNNFHEKRDGPPEYPLMESDRSTVKSGNFGNKKYDRPVAMDLLAVELEGYDQANSPRKP